MASATFKSLTTGDIVELAYGKGGRVCVVPEDNDRLVLPVEDAVNACRAYTNQIRFQSQYQTLIKHLINWLSDNDEKISFAYLTAREVELLFLVVTNESRYNRAFEDDLTELESEIACDGAFDLISMSVQSVPPSEDGSTVAAFLSRPSVRFCRNAQ